MFSNDQLMPQMEGLRRFSMKLTRDGAESDDLLQSTLLRAIEKKHQFEDGTNLFRWTSKIMFNLFISNYNRRTARETQFDPELLISQMSVEPDQEDRLEFKEVCAAIDRLPKHHREILALVCGNGASYEDAANELGIAVGTVRSRVARARANLAEELGRNAPLPALH